MTSEELTQELNKRNITIEIIEEYMKFEDECVKKNFTFRSLLEAREKQIPKKPIIKLGVTDIVFVETEEGHGEYRPETKNYYACPECESYVTKLMRIRDMDVPSGKKRYCSKCGQKLDWSEAE